jgi:hypothetical protein
MNSFLTGSRLKNVKSSPTILLPRNNLFGGKNGMREAPITASSIKHSSSSLHFLNNIDEMVLAFFHQFNHPPYRLVSGNPSELFSQYAMGTLRQESDVSI